MQVIANHKPRCFVSVGSSAIGAAVDLVHSLRLRSGEISLQLLKLSISEIQNGLSFSICT